MTQKIKDFVSIQKPKKHEEPFFGYFRIPKKGIHGPGHFYAKKMENNLRIFQAKRVMRNRNIDKRFEKYYSNPKPLEIMRGQNGRFTKTKQTD